MEEHHRDDDALRDELRQLGANLRAVLHEARESEAWRSLQADIAAGLEDVSAALHGAAEDFAASPTGQRLRDEVDALHDRVRKGDVAETLRSDIVAALRTLNANLGSRRPPPPAGTGTDDGAAQ